MSELITTSPGGSFPAFGLEVISQGPVTLRSGANAPAGGVEAIGSNLADIIRPISPDSTTPLIVSGRESSDQIIGAAGNDRLSGEVGSDTIEGRAGNDFISGGFGDDELFGDLGDDEIFGNVGDDFITGGAGDDQLFGGNGDDRLFGGAGNDILVGGNGDDRLFGGAGDDTLVAGEGLDILNGGEGSDTFVFGRDSTPTSIRTGQRRVNRPDRVQDFSPGEDRILLDQSLVTDTNLRLGTLRRRDFAVVDRLTDSNRETITAAIIYERSKGLVSVNRGEGRISPLLRLQADLPLTASDFEIGSNVDNLA